MRLTVVERSPVATWCGEVLDASSTDCYLLDDGGLAYTTISSTTATYIQYFGPLATSSLPRQYVSPPTFRALTAFVVALTSVHPELTVRSVVVDGDDDVSIITSSGFTMRFVLTDDFSGVLNHLELALGTAPFTTHALSDFTYLDLRFGDRMYYKLKIQ